MFRFKFIIILLCIATSAFAQKKYALLVGVSNYRIMPIAHEWNNIHGREDVEMLMPVFKAQGFNIATLTDGKATHANIVKALDKLSRTVAKGSIVYIHFSTHGQSFDDALSQRKGDEEWDESIVPVDAALSYSDRYRGQNHLVDDELNNYTTAIRRRLGESGMLYVTVDACHAGGASRDIDDVTRGTMRGFSKDKKYQPERERPVYYDAKSQKALAPVIFLEACQGKELNTEIRRNSKYHGPLSYYVHKVISSQPLGKNTAWVYQVKKLMAADPALSNQTMRIEQ